ncbi:phosphate ABC transporter substrate-binding protein, PhoT family [Ruegeria intermedia]|uniref:Phosphate ABC transporter substrate-binding protein, PhoT family n=1 Tax=Ruegeria intermedia TaxID=996115 RepID=A0A1M4SCY1_9RHOB|nr:phosphate ABC transporter substrate-binding/OmpA family protein [Ruegeria intermedia]SHE30015.1 phosphate ABC transporter substrate-binding protein, PhoT family [Ruegeria intermedia]
MAFLRAAVTAVSLFTGISSAQAQDITLTSHDGQVEITGTLLGYDGEFYRVETRFGELTVDGSGVTCDGPACPSLTDFVTELHLSGAPVMAETLFPALIEGFAAREGLTVTRTDLGADRVQLALHRSGRDAPLARFTLHATPTGQAFADLIADETDIALALREIRAPEIAGAREAGLGDLTRPRRSRVVALDALVPVVAPDNPLTQISPADLARVFSGAVTNWAELGGPDAPISLHLPDAGSGLAQAVRDRLMQPAQAQPADTAIRHARGSDLVAAVARDPFAIGIATLAQASGLRALPLAGGCGHALRATRPAIKTEDYPLTLPMFLYLPQRRLPKIARQFLAYALGPEAQMVIRKAGFTDQSHETVRIGLQGDRLANAITSGGSEVGLAELQRMVETLRPLSRLSLSFRFEPGSSRPDAQSRSNILQMAQALESGQYDGRKLVFVGFSDGDGPAESNARIALRRAQTVRNAVLAAVQTSVPDSVDISVEGFGEAMPLACDDTDWGRKANRRVEVWVR